MSHMFVMTLYMLRTSSIVTGIVEMNLRFRLRASLQTPHCEIGLVTWVATEIIFELRHERVPIDREHGSRFAMCFCNCVNFVSSLDGRTSSSSSKTRSLNHSCARDKFRAHNLARTPRHARHGHGTSVSRMSQLYQHTKKGFNNDSTRKCFNTEERCPWVAKHVSPQGSNSSAKPLFFDSSRCLSRVASPQQLSFFLVLSPPPLFFLFLLLFGG